MHHPPPVGNVFKNDPYRATERSGKVSRGGIARDDKIEVLHHCGAVYECVSASIEIFAEGFDPHPGRKTFQLLGASVFLQADQHDAGNIA